MFPVALGLSVLLCKYTICYVFWVHMIHFDFINWGGELNFCYSNYRKSAQYKQISDVLVT